MSFLEKLFGSYSDKQIKKLRVIALAPLGILYDTLPDAGEL